MEASEFFNQVGGPGVLYPCPVARWPAWHCSATCIWPIKLLSRERGEYPPSWFTREARVREFSRCQIGSRARQPVLGSQVWLCMYTNSTLRMEEHDGLGSQIFTCGTASVEKDRQVPRTKTSCPRRFDFSWIGLSH